MVLIAPDVLASVRRGRVRFLVGAIAILGAVTLIGCGKPFNVRPRTELPPANYAATASVNRVTVRADPIDDEDLLYETFDANLILAGVFPVRIRLTNSTDEIVDLKKTRFDVATPQGRRFKPVNAREAFNRLISYYEISTYNKAGYKESLSEFVGYALDTKEALPPRQSRDGVLFFPIPADVARGTGLTLHIFRLGAKESPIELKLN